MRKEGQLKVSRTDLLAACAMFFVLYHLPGNVGYRKQAQQDPQCAYRIGQNIARKCKRLGISQVEVKFRRIMRVNQVLQAFVAHGLGVSSITHEPRLPKCGQNATKPRKRRRV